MQPKTLPKRLFIMDSSFGDLNL